MVRSISFHCFACLAAAAGSYFELTLFCWRVSRNIASAHTYHTECASFFAIPFILLYLFFLHFTLFFTSYFLCISCTVLRMFSRLLQFRVNFVSFGWHTMAFTLFTSSTERRRKKRKKNHTNDVCVVSLSQAEANSFVFFFLYSTVAFCCAGCDCVCSHVISMYSQFCSANKQGKICMFTITALEWWWRSSFSSARSHSLSHALSLSLSLSLTNTHKTTHNHCWRLMRCFRHPILECCWVAKDVIDEISTDYP